MEAHGEQYVVEIETVKANITTSDFDSAYTIAEFILNLIPMHNPPFQRDLEDYVQKHFVLNGDGLRFSCDQDLLQIRKR